jgi:hypothetical protein
MSEKTASSKKFAVVRSLAVQSPVSPNGEKQASGKNTREPMASRPAYKVKEYRFSHGMRLQLASVYDQQADQSKDP